MNEIFVTIFFSPRERGSQVNYFQSLQLQGDYDWLEMFFELQCGPVELKHQILDL